MTARYALPLAALAACSPGATVSHTMAPRSCATPPWDHLTPQATIAAPRGTEVGVTIGKGRGAYALDGAFVEVLRPGAATDPDLTILRHENPSVLSASAGAGPAADRRVSVVWRGVDRDGAALPYGRYPVVFAIATHGAGACRGDAGVSGVLATLDWRG